MRVSDAVKVDPTYRKLRKAIGIKNAINIRLNWLKKCMPDRVTPTIQYQVSQTIEAIDEIITIENNTPSLVSNVFKKHRSILDRPTKEVLRDVFPGLPEPKASQRTIYEDTLVELMEMRGRDTAKQIQTFTLMCEIAHRAKEGWFMIFNTLTVQPGDYYRVFKRDSTAWQDYIRTIDRMAANAGYGSIRKASGKDYHTYFAVIEEGGKYGRLHIHCLHFFKKLPRSARDPNLGASRPTERELHCLRGAWPHGRSAPIIVRYSPRDAFGQIGYRWPIDTKTGEPMVIKSPMALANYMSKYLQKGYNSCQRSKLLWRVRKTQKLGHHVLNALTEQLSISTLLILATADNLKVKLNNTRIPQALLRYHSLKQLRDRQYTANGNSYTLTALAKLAMPRLSPLHYSRASTQTIQENSLQSTQYLSTLGLNTEASFEAATEELYTQAKIIDKQYFPRSTKAYGTTSTRDDLNGT